MKNLVRKMYLWIRLKTSLSMVSQDEKAELFMKAFASFYDELQKYTSTVFEIRAADYHSIEVSFGVSHYLLATKTDYINGILYIETGSMRLKHPTSQIEWIEKLKVMRKIDSEKWYWASNAVIIENVGGEYVKAIKERHV